MWTRLLSILLASAPLARGQDPPRPNILLAIADDWGWPHASAYGDPVVETPTFDRIAKEGTLFHQAYVSSPSCTPSRAALVTGQWHWRLEESANLWSTLRASIPTYPDLLAHSGYHVGHTRKGWGPGRLEPGGRETNPAGKKYADFEAFLAARPEGAPFCFWFGSHDPHRGYEEGSGARSGMALDDVRLPGCFPDTPEVRSDVADYYFEVQRFDREVGELLAVLERAGELDDTLVVITGDHGMPFPRGKSNLYDLGTRVPLAVRWPEHARAGSAVEAFVSLTDLAPTFLAAAGVEVPEVVTGRSLLGLLNGKDTGRDRSFVLTGKERHVPCQEAPISGGYPCRAIRTARYLYIRNFEPDRWPAGTPNDDQAFFSRSWLGDSDNGPTKSAIVELKGDETRGHFYQLAFGKRPAEELYDLSTDPEQLHDVASDPDHGDVRSRLAAKLIAELEASGDPRVVGGAERFEAFPYYGGTPRK